MKENKDRCPICNSLLISKWSGVKYSNKKCTYFFLFLKKKNMNGGFSVGKRKKNHPCGAVIIQLNLNQFDVSHNEYEYWISVKLIDNFNWFYIQKDTEEGIYVKELIAKILDKDNFDEINAISLEEFLFEILKNNYLTFENFLEVIAKTENRGFYRGKEFQQNQMRKALGL